MLQKNTPVALVLDRGLWASQLTLAAILASAGFTLLGATPTELAQAGFGSAARIPGQLLPVVGALELLIAAALVVPAGLRLAPKLTPWAATALAVAVGLVSVDHLLHATWLALPADAFLVGLSAFVAWGRGRAVPVQARLATRPVHA